MQPGTKELETIFPSQLDAYTGTTRPLEFTGNVYMRGCSRDLSKDGRKISQVSSRKVAQEQHIMAVMKKWADDRIDGGGGRMMAYNAAQRIENAHMPNLGENEANEQFMQRPGPDDILSIFCCGYDASTVSLPT